MADEAPTLVEGAHPQEVTDVPPGPSSGRYVILQPLGKGGMGTVYAAYDTELDRRVALKFLHNSDSEEAEAWRERLMREARAMARVSHPNVVTLYDVGLSNDGRVFLAMEVVEGGTLSDWLRTQPRSWREIVSLLCEAGEGLAAAHHAGMVHRDFKLDNVLFGKDGRPRVTNFGLVRGIEVPRTVQDPLPAVAGARPLSPGSGPRSASVPSARSSTRSLSSTLTMTGVMLGTPGYMAPEQYTNDVEVNARADVFAFCATLYRALYGERAFPGKTAEEIGDSTLRGAVRDVPKGSNVPTWVRRILLWGLSTDREARPASMTVLLAALRADPARLRSRWLAAGAALAVTGAVALTVDAAGQRRIRACQAMADRMGGVWDDPRKEAIGKAFHATGLSYADDTWGRVERRLDGYAASWKASMLQACEDVRVKGERSEASLDLRGGCLEDRRDELRALSDVFVAADAKTVSNAAKAASSLTSLDSCSNLDQLSAVARLPPEPGARAEIRALQAEIANAKELSSAGKPMLSRQRLERIHDRVEATKYGPLRLAWTMVLAPMNSEGDAKAGARDWEEAIAIAETSRMDRQKADCQIGLGGYVLNSLGRYDEAHLWLGLASATLARIGGDPELEIRRDGIEAFIFFNEGKYGDAVRVARRAIERASANHVNLPVPLADAHSALSLALVYIARDERSFEEAVGHAREGLRIVTEALGPQHLNVGESTDGVAGIELESGRLGDALATASRATEVFRAGVERGELAATNVHAAMALQTTGAALLRMGRAAEAAAALEQGRRISRDVGATGDLGLANVTLAEAWRQLGRLGEAQRLCEETRAEQTEETQPEQRIELELVMARIALDGGRADLALPLAERGLALALTGASPLYQLSSARLVVALALAAAKQDPVRAHALAEQARDGFTALRNQPRIDVASALLSQR